MKTRLKIFRDDFFTRMGPSVPELFRGDFSPKWDHLCPKRKILPGSNYYCGDVILPICCCFSAFLISLLLLIFIFFFICCFLLACRFSPKWDHLCPRYLGMTFSPEWDHLCPRYLGVIFHSGGTICAQNVDFTWKQL